MQLPQSSPSSLWGDRKGGRNNAVIFCVVFGEGKKAGEDMQLGSTAAPVPVRYCLLQTNSLSFTPKYVQFGCFIDISLQERIDGRSETA